MYSELLVFQGASSDLSKKETDLLTDLERVLATATDLPVGSAGPWTQESQLFALDREWRFNPSAWLREMTIVIGEAYECAVACSRWWNKFQRLLDMDRVTADGFMDVRITFEAVLKDYIVACARVSYLMERWSQTGYYSLPEWLDSQTVRSYSPIMPEPSYFASEANNSRVSQALSRFGTTWSRQNIRISRHFSSLVTGSAQVRQSVSALRNLRKETNQSRTAVRVWIEVFRLYCCTSEIGPASIVLLSEFRRIFLSRPRRLGIG